jgi:sulfur-oxidizing protein SoxY
MTHNPLHGVLSRRRLLISAGGGGAAMAAMTLVPGLVLADAASVAESMTALIGDAAPSEGRIELDLPQIAENGNTVPISISIDSPMMADDYVKAVHVFAEGNPRPNVASFHFTPACGEATCSTRIRLAKTQNIVAVAQMNNGDVYMAKAEVKVTIGGCGG